MTITTSGLAGKPMNGDYGPTIPTTFVPPDDGLGGNNGGQGPTVTPATFASIIVKQGIHGGCPVDPNSPVAPGGPDTSTPPVDPMRDIGLWAEPSGPTSPTLNLIGGIGDKPIIKDSSWIGADKKAECPWYVPDIICDIDDAENGSTGKDKDPGPKKDNSDTHGHNVPNPSGHGAGTWKNKYVNPEDDQSHGEILLPDPSQLAGTNHSVPAGLGLDLGLINSMTGGNYTFGLSGLAKLGVGGTPDPLESGIPSAQTGGGTKTNSGGGADPGGADHMKSGSDEGDATAPTSAFDALLQMFGLKDLDAHLKNGTFDLDNFEALLYPTNDFGWDLNGNGTHDMFEYIVETGMTAEGLASLIAGRSDVSYDYIV
jgi:hypothetical protein